MAKKPQFHGQFETAKRPKSEIIRLGQCDELEFLDASPTDRKGTFAITAKNQGGFVANFEGSA